MPDETVAFNKSARVRVWAAIVLALAASAIGWGVKLYLNVRASSESFSCECNLRLIGSALKSYSQHYGCLPPAYTCDPNGSPANSWRTLIVHNFWYGFPDTGYALSQPWNGPRNLSIGLRQIPIREFRCPTSGPRDSTITNYAAVTGPNTVWPGSEPTKVAADGSENEKILVIEVVNSDILWMEPRDLTLEQALDAIQPKKGIGIGGRHHDGIHYVTVGGDVRTLDPNIDRESLRKLLVRDLPKRP